MNTALLSVNMMSVALIIELNIIMLCVFHSECRIFIAMLSIIMSHMVRATFYNYTQR